MLRLKIGDRVRIIDRPTSPADTKSGLFYNYYRNLTGTVFNVFGKDATAQVAIEVDLDVLPAEVAKRHYEVRDQMRNTLSGEAKRAAAPGAEHEFRLRYVILVALPDLTRAR